MPQNGTIARPTFALPHLTIKSLLAWLVEADHAYREKTHIQTLSQSHLRDVGLTRLDSGRITRI